MGSVHLRGPLLALPLTSSRPPQGGAHGTGCGRSMRDTPSRAVAPPEEARTGGGAVPADLLRVRRDAACVGPRRPRAAPARPARPTHHTPLLAPAPAMDVVVVPPRPPKPRDLGSPPQSRTPPSVWHAAAEEPSF